MHLSPSANLVALETSGSRQAFHGLLPSPRSAQAAALPPIFGLPWELSTGQQFSTLREVHRHIASACEAGECHDKQPDSEEHMSPSPGQPSAKYCASLSDCKALALREVRRDITLACEADECPARTARHARPPSHTTSHALPSGSKASALREVHRRFKLACEADECPNSDRRCRRSASGAKQAATATGAHANSSILQSWCAEWCACGRR